MSKKKKVHKKQKTLKKYTEQEILEIKAKKFTNDPIFYCNSKPVTLGTVVYLKDSNEINSTYSRRLCNLIKAKHRFVITFHLKGLVKDDTTVAICLLSTSSYLNQTQELGIKLYGKYSEYADVYMDARECWIIDRECVKDIAYTLIEEDKARCTINYFNNSAGKVSVIRGLTNNNIVDKNIEKYKEFLSKSNNNQDQTVQELQMDHNTGLLYHYVWALTDEQIYEYINSQPKYILSQAQFCLNMYLDKEDIDTPRKRIRQLMVAVLSITGDADDLILSLKRGY